MKLKLVVFAIFLFTGFRILAQVIEPSVTINDNPGIYSNSMHICFDGEFYYTINGGSGPKDGKFDGKINKFRPDGKFLASYPINMDMRSIMYNGKDKCFYINTADKNLYKFVAIEKGTYMLAQSNMYKNDQICLAMDPKGKNYYALDEGEITIISVKTGKPAKKFSGIKCGANGLKGSSALAVDKKYIYTWDADTKTVYAYKKRNGAFKKSFILKSGSLGHSLSYASGMIFVSKSERGKPSTWYGYKLPIK